jgi:hypothetical protein
MPLHTSSGGLASTQRCRLAGLSVPTGTNVGIDRMRRTECCVLIGGVGVTVFRSSKAQHRNIIKTS